MWMGQGSRNNDSSMLKLTETLDSVLGLAVHEGASRAVDVAESTHGSASTAMACYLCYVPVLAVAVHAVFLVLVAVGHVRSQAKPGKQSDQKKPARLHRDAKFVSLGLLVLEVVRLWPSLGASPSRSALAWHGSEAVAWLAIFAALQREEASGRATFGNILRAWWGALVLFSAAAFSTAFSSGQIVNAAVDFASLVSSLFMVVGSHCGAVHHRGRADGVDASANEPLLSESVSDAAPGSSGFSRAGLASVLAFSWLNPLLNVGIARPLKITDVPLLDPTDAPKANHEAFQEEWKRRRLATPPGEIPSMTWALVTTFWRPFVLSLTLIVLLVMAQFVAPLVQSRLIEFMAAEPRSVSAGFGLVSLLLAGKFAESVFGHQLVFRSRKLGLRMWAAVGCAVYGKALRLSLKARQVRGVGDITNIMSSDLQRLVDLGYYIQQGLVVPMQVVVAVVILFEVVGVAMLAGLASLVLVLLLNALIVRRMRAFRAKLLAVKDRRMRATTECLGNLKAIKLQTWDAMFRERIERIREEERGWVLRFMLNWGNAIFMVWNGPLVISGVTFFAMVLLGEPLTAARVYTALTTFKIIQEPIRFIPDVIANIVQATVSIQRIGAFLMEDEVDETAVERNSEESEFAVLIEGAAFAWDKAAAPPALENLSLKIERGSCVAICGAVGSGKSSLLFCIMGELPRLAGTAKVCGRVAYVAQSAWIQNNSIRENILFGRALDPHRYHEAVRVSGLVSDLAELPHGDETEIGERGTTLSGGQKQRVQLARAVYQDADVYLLDDPFSAVDAHTGSFLFEECVKGALKGKTVILTTHQVEFLPAVDQILVMRAPGEIVQRGTYDELVQEGRDFGAFVDALEESLHRVNRASHISLDGAAAGRQALADSVTQMRGASLVSAEALISRAGSPSKSSSGKADESAKPTKRKLVQEEVREVGRVDSKVVWSYLSKVGKGSLWALTVVPQVATTSFMLASDLWLASGTSSETPTTLRFMWIYCSFLLGCSMSVYARTRLVSYTGVATAQAFFSGMLDSIVRAPMSFIDSTPVGRILSRCSTDQTALDVELPFLVAGVGNNAISLIGNSLITTFVTPQLLFLTIPLGYLFAQLQKFFITSSRELSRLTSLTEAPLFLHISESVGGATTIRVFQEQSRFADTNVLRLEAYERAYFHNMTAAEWLGTRLDALSAAVLSCAAILLITRPEGSIAPGLAGISLSHGLSLSGILMRLVSSGAMAEVRMVSVERIMQYSNIPSEAPTVIPDSRPPSSWPHAGRIEAHHLQIRYRPDLPLVLKGVSFVIHPQENVGVVGRTGSGKSTLIQALFRLIEPSGGRILIDGLDIATIGLKDLRSVLGVIPQEPTLFEGSVRSNLDPFDACSDRQIWESLEKCQLGHIVRDKARGLDSAVSEQGENWSVGERQLLCLARALLKQARILVLDEATASVDITTDAVIQLAIKRYFAECTVISVAHRIPTVIDSDRVLVLENGYVMENNSPEHLLADENSMFSKLVKEYTSRTGSSGNMESLGFHSSTILS